jgi:hypothetical protein
MTGTYLSKLILCLKTRALQSFLHLQQTRHQLPLAAAGLHRLDVDSITAVAIILRM